MNKSGPGPFPRRVIGEAALWQWVEFAAGAVVVAVTLVDIFATLLIPGPVVGRFGMILNMRRISLPLFLLAARRRVGEDRRPSNAYAPVTFMLTFLVWLLLLMLGFGMTMQAVAYAFHPRIASLSDALWIAGSSLLTLGVSEYDASGIARWLVLGAGLSGFGALTTAITFMLQLQAGLNDREPAVLRLADMAGTPPSGVKLLETMAELDARRHLEKLFIDWRDWCSATLHSHLAFPGLNYFRSVDTENDWLSAMEAVLDAATLVVACLDEPTARGAAMLLHRTGSRTAERLCAAFQLEPERSRLRGEEVGSVLERLGQAGYQVREDGAAARFGDLREAYAPHIKALAHHLGGNRAPVDPKRE